MRKTFYLIAVLAVFVPSILAQQYRSYTNVRYAFSVEYPSGILIPQNLEDASHSGNIFLSKDKQVEMRTWGEYNALEVSFKEKYDSALQDFKENPSYMVFKDDWFVLSGMLDGKIYYRKTLVRHLRDIDVFFTLTIAYPPKLKAKYDPIVKKIAASFKFDPKADV